MNSGDDSVRAGQVSELAAGFGKHEIFQKSHECHPAVGDQGCDAYFCWPNGPDGTRLGCLLRAGKTARPPAIGRSFRPVANADSRKPANGLPGAM